MNGKVRNASCMYLYKKKAIQTYISYDDDTWNPNEQSIIPAPRRLYLVPGTQRTKQPNLMQARFRFLFPFLTTTRSIYVYGHCRYSNTKNASWSTMVQWTTTTPTTSHTLHVVLVSWSTKKTHI